MPTPRRVDVWVFWAMFAAVFVARGGAAYATTLIGVDGGYYMGVAEQVRRGFGISSNLSIYNFGYTTFPSPSCIYPLWPLLLGTVGRFVDLEAASHWLPWGLYMLSGIGAFLFGRAALPDPLWRRLPWLHAGHLLAALLWLNPQYRIWSVAPFTEPLGWALLMFGLWRYARKRGELGVAWGLELGLWAVLPFFARAQLMVFPMAVGCALALRLALGPDRPRFARFAGAVLLPIVAAIGAWWWRVASFTWLDGPTVLLRFDRCRVNDLLPELPVMFPTEGFAGYLRDRLSGIEVAWGFTDTSYWETFYVLHWVTPVAIVAALVAAIRHRAGLGARALAFLRGADGHFWATLALLAGGGWLSVQLVHKQFSSPWYFDQREGLVAWFLFAFATVGVLRRGGLTGVLGAGLAAVSIAYGARATWREASFEAPRPHRDEHATLAAELRRRDAAEPGPLVVALEEGHAQRTAWQAPEIGFHWVSTRSTYETVGVMVKDLGADMVIWDNPRASWPFLRNGGHIEAEYVELTGLPWPFKGVAPRTTPLPPAPPRRVLLVGIDGLGGERLPADYARFEMRGANALSWRRIVTGKAQGGPRVWEVAEKAGRSVGVYGWPGEEHGHGVEGALGAEEDFVVLHVADEERGELSRLLEGAAEDAVVVVVEIADGGAPDAVWFAGADVPKGRRPHVIGTDDVAPTVAWLLGLPVARSLKGRVVSEALDWDAAGALGRRDVGGW